MGGSPRLNMTRSIDSKQFLRLLRSGKKLLGRFVHSIGAWLHIVFNLTSGGGVQKHARISLAKEKVSTTRSTASHVTSHFTTFN